MDSPAEEEDDKKKGRRKKKGGRGAICSLTIAGDEHKTQAEAADRHALYQIAVQTPKKDIQLFVKHFHGLRHRKPLSLREDFCGTAILCSEWARQDSQRTAVGVDISGEVLAWGREHNLQPLGPAAERVTLIEANVLDVPKITAAVGEERRFDVVAALNFSVFLFPVRRELIKYLKSARAALESDGVLFADLLGGLDCFEPGKKFRKKFDTFTYQFETEKFSVLDNSTAINISFRFPDNSWLKKAFRYEWRLYSIPEIRDALHDAGFKRVKIWWTDINDEEETEFKEYEEAPMTENWLAYFAAYD